MVLGELKLAGEVLLGPAAGEVPSWGRRQGSWMSRKLGREEEILGGGKSGRGGQEGDPGEVGGEAGRRAGDALGGDALGEAIPMVFEFQIDRRVLLSISDFWGCRKSPSAPYKSERRETFPSMTRCLR